MEAHRGRPAAGWGLARLALLVASQCWQAAGQAAAVKPPDPQDPGEAARLLDHERSLSAKLEAELTVERDGLLARLRDAEAKLNAMAKASGAAPRAAEAEPSPRYALREASDPPERPSTSKGEAQVYSLDDQDYALDGHTFDGRRLTASCADTDNGATDGVGDGCVSGYDDFPHTCGNRDDDDFTSADMCCACNGGIVGSCDAADGSALSSFYPCACASSTCSSNQLCNATDGGCSAPASCTETDGSTSSAAYPCSCGSDVCSSGEVCDAAAGICASVCSATNGLDVSGSYPCLCGTATCSSNEVCDASTDACAPAACDVTDGSGASSSYPCSCGSSVTCTANPAQSSYDWCHANASDLGASSCSPCVVPRAGKFEAARAECPAGEVRICGGVTTVPDWAFFGCSAVTRVIVGDSVTGIGSNAFGGCTALEEVVFGSSVESIGDRAFQGCSSLRELATGDALLRVGPYAFDGCSSLQRVELGSSTTSIGERAFLGCTGLEAVDIHSDLTDVGAEAFSSCQCSITMTFGAGATHIAQSLFSGDGVIQAVVIGDSVVDIGEGAFQGCAALQTVMIGESVAEIGANAFRGCSELADLTLGPNVSRIGSSGFEQCGSLTNVTIPASVVEVDSSAFSGCSQLQQVSILGNVDNIGLNVFMDTNLTKMTFGPPATHVGDFRLYDCCNNISDVALADSIESLGANVFRGLRLSKLELPPSVVTIGESAFQDCAELTAIAMPSSVEDIGESAFQGCQKLVDVHIGENTTTIGRQAFKHCVNLQNLTMGDSVREIGESAFEGCANLGNVTLGEGVNLIGTSAFQNCSKLQSVILPESEHYLGNKVFSGCMQLEELTVAGNAYLYYANYYDDVYASNIFTDTSLRKVSFGPRATHIADLGFRDCCAGLTEVVIADTVETIGKNAFARLPIRDVQLPGNVTFIGSGAFQNCSRLQSVVLPESVRHLGGRAFFGCTELQEVSVLGDIGLFDFCSDDDEGVAAIFAGTGLRRVSFGPNVSHISDLGFRDCCANLTDIAIADGVESIDENAFRQLPIREISLPDSVILIGASAFRGCRDLTAVHLGEGVVRIAESAFQDCSRLQGVVLPYLVKYIGRRAFAGCAELQELDISGDVDLDYYDDDYDDADGFHVFANTSLHRVSFGPNVSHIADLGFRNCCANLTDIAIGDSVETIGKNAFAQLPIQEVHLPEGVGRVERGAFQNCSRLQNITIPESVESIGSRAFAGCTELREVSILGNANDYDDDDDDYCPARNIFVGTGLRSVSFGPPATKISDLGFRDCCANLTDIAIGDSVETIGKNAFAQLPIQEVSIPDGNLTDIRSDAFRNCSKLESVVVPASVKHIGFRAFSGCTELREVSILGDMTGNEYYDDVGMDVFANTSLRSVSFGPPATHVKDFGLRRCCTDVTDIVLAYSVEKIERFAFSGLRVRDVALPDSLEVIGDSAFQDCRELTRVRFGENLSSIGVSAFESTALQEVNVPPSTVAIYRGAFSNCANIRNLSVGDSSGSSLQTVDRDIFNSSCGITHVFVNNSEQTVEFARLIPECAQVERIVVAGGQVSKSMLSGNCGRLSSLEIHGEVVPEGAWRLCPSLHEVRLGDAVRHIKSSAFDNCTGLTEVTFGRGLVRMDEFAFAQCPSIEAVLINSTRLQHLGRGLFENCSGLQSALFLNSTITRIPSRAFSGCSSLEFFNIPDDVLFVDDHAFENATALENVSSSRKVEYFADTAFEGAFPPRGPSFHVRDWRPGFDVPPSPLPECKPTFRVDVQGNFFVCACPRGYRYIPPPDHSTDGTCKLCDSTIEQEKHFVCPGGYPEPKQGQDPTVEDFTVMVEDGFMTLRSDPFSVYQCVRKQNCPGNRAVAPLSSDPYSMCDQNFDDDIARCAYCKPNHYMSRSFDCWPCDATSRGLLYVKAGGAYVLSLAGSMYMYKRFNRPAPSGVITVGAIVTFIQALQSVSKLDLSNSEALKAFLSILVWLELPGIFHFFEINFECWDGNGSDFSILRQAVSPLTIFLNFLVLQAIFVLMKNPLKLDFVHNIIGLLFTKLFITVVFLSLSMFYLVIMPSGKEMLRAFPDIEFLSDRWWRFLPINLACTLLYGATTISYTIWIVWTAPRRASSVKGFGAKYRFCFGAFRPDRWWWILVNLAFALTLNMAQVFLPAHNVYSKVYVSLFFTVLFISLQFNVWPFKFEANNWVALAFKITILLYLLLSTAFVDVPAEDLDSIRELFGGIIIAGICSALAFAIYKFTRWFMSVTQQLDVSHVSATEAAWAFRDVATAVIALSDKEFGARMTGVGEADCEVIKRMTDTLVNVVFHQQSGTSWLRQRVILGQPYRVWDHSEMVLQNFDSINSGCMQESLLQRIRVRKLMIKVSRSMSEVVSSSERSSTQKRIKAGLQVAAGHSRNMRLVEERAKVLGITAGTPLAKERFRDLMTEFHVMDLTEEEMDLIFDVLDTDDSGSVQLQEFVAMLAAMAPKDLVERCDEENAVPKGDDVGVEFNAEDVGLDAAAPLAAERGERCAAADPLEPPPMVAAEFSPLPPRGGTATVTTESPQVASLQQRV